MEMRYEKTKERQTFVMQARRGKEEEEDDDGDGDDHEPLPQPVQRLQTERKREK